MGDYNHFPAVNILDHFGKSPEFEAQEIADKNIRKAKLAADAMATRLLAEMNCPNDLLEWGRAHGIPTFAEVTWQAGFMAGWRIAQAALLPPSPPSREDK